MNHLQTKKTNRSNKSMLFGATVNDVNLFSDLGRGFMVANVRLSLGLKRALCGGASSLTKIIQY